MDEKILYFTVEAPDRGQRAGRRTHQIDLVSMGTVPPLIRP